MPKTICIFVHFVDRLNKGVGRAAMYFIFAMMGILLYSSVSKAFFHPSLWSLKMALFSMIVYYLMRGAYSMQMGAHIRKDLACGRLGAARADFLRCA